MSHPQYRRYKESGMEWLGEVPDHWSVGQSRRLFAQRKERAHPSDQQLTSSQKLGIVTQDEFIEVEGRSVVKVIDGTEILKHVEPGDFVISMRSFQGGIERSEVRGSISSAYVMLIPIKSVYGPFFRYLLKSDRYIQALQSTSNLVRDGQAMRYENFTQIDLPLIPIDEQRSIAEFLDRETGRIDALLDQQRRMIELLNERVSALVLSSIGLTETKELRLKHVAEMIRRPLAQIEGESYIPIGIFNRGRGIFHKDPREVDEMGDSDFFWVEEGDLIISGQFAWEGSVALAGPNDTGCVVTHRYPILHGKPGVCLTEYLLALLLTRHGDFLLNENSRGAAGRNRPLNINSLMKEKVPIPNMRTQKKIAESLYWKNDLIRKMLKQEALLKEHRNALVSDAVTGKIDVRSFRPQEATQVCQ